MPLTLACSEAGCVEATDPRKEGRCVRCGTPMSHSEPLYRDLQLEEEIVKLACRGKIAPDWLISHSQTRSKAFSGEYVDHPDLILRGRNRLLDMREEACDAVNHGTFDLQEHPEYEDFQEVVEIIGLFAEAYERLRRLEIERAGS